jgi:hypothetical protein
MADNHSDNNDNYDENNNTQINHMDALVDIMNRLAQLTVNNQNNNTNREYNLVKVDYFTGNEDPMEWWQNFEKAAKANNWNDERQFVLAPTYLRKAADIWYKSLRPGQRPLDIEEFRNAFLQQF